MSAIQSSINNLDSLISKKVSERLSDLKNSVYWSYVFLKLISWASYHTETDVDFMIIPSGHNTLTERTEDVLNDVLSIL